MLGCRLKSASRLGVRRVVSEPPLPKPSKSLKEETVPKPRSEKVKMVAVAAVGLGALAWYLYDRDLVQKEEAIQKALLATKENLGKERIGVPPSSSKEFEQYHKDHAHLDSQKKARKEGEHHKEHHKKHAKHEKHEKQKGEEHLEKSEPKTTPASAPISIVPPVVEVLPTPLAPAPAPPPPEPESTAVIPALGSIGACQALESTSTPEEESHLHYWALPDGVKGAMEAFHSAPVDPLEHAKKMLNQLDSGLNVRHEVTLDELEAAERELVEGMEEGDLKERLLGRLKKMVDIWEAAENEKSAALASRDSEWNEHLSEVETQKRQALTESAQLMSKRSRAASMSLAAAEGELQALGSSLDRLSNEKREMIGAASLALSSLNLQSLSSGSSFLSEVGEKVDGLKKEVMASGDPMLTAVLESTKKLVGEDEALVYTPGGLRVRFESQMGDFVTSAFLTPKLCNMGIAGHVIAWAFGKMYKIDSPGGGGLNGLSNPNLEHLRKASVLLDKGDLRGAVSSLDKMEGASKEAVRKWVEEAKDTLDFLQTLRVVQMKINCKLAAVGM